MQLLIASSSVFSVSSGKYNALNLAGLTLHPVASSSKLCKIL